MDTRPRKDTGRWKHISTGKKTSPRKDARCQKHVSTGKNTGPRNTVDPS